MAISSSLKILVVDDDPNIRETLKIILNGIGFKKIKMAVDAKSALEYISTAIKTSTDIPEFIMSDYDMPGGTGIDLFKALQKNGETKKIPFLLISGVSDKSFIIDAKEVGIKFILLKPFTQQSLVKEMARILNKK